jgi:hypothetical protein
MGQVLSFTPRRAAVKQPPLSTQAAASIIIFPGVRYERQHAAVSAPAAGQPLPPLGKPSPHH